MASGVSPFFRSLVLLMSLALRVRAENPPAPEGMVLIKGGTFAMGSKDGASDEQPVHELTIKSFFMDRTEVTWDAYGRCVTAGGCTAIGSGREEARPVDRPEHPFESCFADHWLGPEVVGSVHEVEQCGRNPSCHVRALGGDPFRCAFRPLAG